MATSHNNYMAEAGPQKRLVLTIIWRQKRLCVNNYMATDETCVPY